MKAHANEYIGMVKTRRYNVAKKNTYTIIYRYSKNKMLQLSKEEEHRHTFFSIGH